MSVKQWKICKLNNMQKKSIREPSLRRLWRDCFQDPFSYEDYYFQNVYPGNTVYILECETENRQGDVLLADGKADMLKKDSPGEQSLKRHDVLGMLHLNPYSCMANGVNITLHYIVGVATAKEVRRQGIMRKLLCRALLELYKAEEPFTYLMPADVQYYEPFDFVQVCVKEEWNIETASEAELSFCASPAGHDVIYMDFDALKDCFGEDVDCLFSMVDMWLGDNYSGFASHDRKYFKLLAREKECENGAVIFCFDRAAGMENLLGFFAYGREDETVYVEQSVLFETAKWNLTGMEGKPHMLAGRKRIQEILKGYFGDTFMKRGTVRQDSGLQDHNLECVKICQIASYPYMVRVVHVESFLNLYADCFYEYAKQGIRLCVEDVLLLEAVDTCLPERPGIPFCGEGIYVFSKTGDKVTIKQDASQTEYDVKMTVSELTWYVFGKKGRKLFFAELV